MLNISIYFHMSEQNYNTDRKFSTVVAFVRKPLPIALGLYNVYPTRCPFLIDSQLTWTTITSDDYYVNPVRKANASISGVDFNPLLSLQDIEESLNFKIGKKDYTYACLTRLPDEEFKEVSNTQMFNPILLPYNITIFMNAKQARDINFLQTRVLNLEQQIVRLQAITEHLVDTIDHMQSWQGKK